MSKTNLKKMIRANDRIRVPEVRLVDEKGEQVGVVPIKEALKMAEEAGLDLVEVAAQASPPVCRILDLGKYIYTLSKKEKEAKKKQKLVEVKEIKLSSKIGEHDYQTKLRNAHRFILRGDRVKLTMFFKGREIAHSDLGRAVIERFVNDMSEVAGIEKDEGLEGRMIHLLLVPKELTKKSPAKNAEKKEDTEDAKVKNTQSV